MYIVIRYAKAAVFYTTHTRTREFVGNKKEFLTLKGRRNSLVAKEGVPLLLAFSLLTGLCCYYFGWYVAIPPAAVTLVLYFLFQDPTRKIPPHPLAAVSPVDGVVVEIKALDSGITDSAAHRITIKVNAFGTYTARSPVEGVLQDFHSRATNKRPDTHAPGFWVRTDEGDDVALQFHGYRFGLVPRAFSGYGERIGQGQRCANLRLVRIAEVYLPINSRVMVVAGQRVVAGSDILGTLPHPS
jgi:phosphatidylserine decarboxylase